MGIFDFLTQRNKNTASVAKDRLRILIEQERGMRGAPDYLPLLQRELLEVIRKYINVDIDAVKVDLHKHGENELLDISVTLPEKSTAAAATA
jgi:cell division topological specificity factor